MRERPPPPERKRVGGRVTADDITPVTCARPHGEVLAALGGGAYPSVSVSLSSSVSGPPAQYWLERLSNESPPPRRPPPPSEERVLVIDGSWRPRPLTLLLLHSLQLMKRGGVSLLPVLHLGSSHLRVTGSLLGGARRRGPTWWQRGGLGRATGSAGQVCRGREERRG